MVSELRDPTRLIGKFGLPTYAMNCNLHSAEVNFGEGQF